MTDYTLVAPPLTYSVVTGANGGASRADPLTYSLVLGPAALRRSFTANIGDLTLKLDQLKKQQSYFNADGTPTVLGQLHDQRQREAIEAAFNRLAETVVAIQAAYNAAAQASAAASEASSAAVEVRGDVSSVVDTVTAIEQGTYNFPAITVGGAGFVYDGYGELIIR